MAILDRVTIHLLRRESVTPIAIYIARCDERPDSFDRWLREAGEEL